MKKPRDGTKVIPPEEFGAGMFFDPVNNRIIGVSGTVYENVEIRASDLMRAFPPPPRH